MSVNKLGIKSCGLGLRPDGLNHRHAVIRKPTSRPSQAHVSPCLGNAPLVVTAIPDGSHEQQVRNVPSCLLFARHRFFEDLIQRADEQQGSGGKPLLVMSSRSFVW